MVKNAGGNKAKGFARKSFAKGSNSLRISQNELEVYAQVTKLLGGTNCHVVDEEGTTLLCHIRGKFRGRGKRDNFLAFGTWILVGLRDWEKEPSAGKLLNCDILEVYNDYDKERLKSTVTSVNWNNFITNDNKNSSMTATETNDDIEFSTAEAEEYRALIASQLEQENAGVKTTIVLNDEDEVDVDDI